MRRSVISTKSAVLLLCSAITLSACTTMPFVNNGADHAQSNTQNAAGVKRAASEQRVSEQTIAASTIPAPKTLEHPTPAQLPESPVTALPSAQVEPTAAAAMKAPPAASPPAAKQEALAAADADGTYLDTNYAELPIAPGPTQTEVTAAPYAFLWDVFREHAQLPLAVNVPRVQAQRNWYKEHQHYLQRVLERAKPYLYHILSETVARDLPSELVLVPFVESAFDPFAYSQGHAAGLWQFIPSTAAAYGMVGNWWFEPRRDTRRATSAALTYLGKLNRQFDGDWMLALAAYNCGATTVRRAMARNKRRGASTDFWSLDLPHETRAYVPKIIALAQIFSDPAQHHVTLTDIPYAPYFEVVTVNGQFDLALASQLSGTPLSDLYLLNAGLNRWASAPEGPHEILIPALAASQFREGLQTLKPAQRAKWFRYTIRSGDTIDRIARRFNLTSALLRQVNDLRRDHIVAGQILLVPETQQRLVKYQHAPAADADALAGTYRTNHMIKTGDSLWSLAKKYDVAIADLAHWNQISTRTTLVDGDFLTIYTRRPVADPQLQDHRIRKFAYRARKGDSYARIANRFNVSLHELQRWNRTELSDYLRPGDQVTLFVDILDVSSGGKR